MNAHLDAHLAMAQAPPQRDCVHAAFLRASKDGQAISAESEWRRFLGELTALKVCSSNKERRVLEEAWATSETPTAKRLTWTDFRNHVVSQFLDSEEQSAEARGAVRRVRAAARQLQALSLVDNAPLKRCRELLERCRDADKALEAGELLVEASLKSNAKDLEAWRARAMTANDDSEDDEELLRPANPVQWQLTHCLEVEKAASQRRVSTRDQVKFPRGGGRVEDVWGLGAGYTSCVEVRRARVLCADGEQRDALVVALVPPRRGARVDPRTQAEARKACWRTYAAHRDLACSSGLCKPYGALEEQPLPHGRRKETAEDAPLGDGPWFVYERPKGASSLVQMLAKLENKKRRPPPLSASSPLIRHWLREALSALADVDRCATYSLHAPFPGAKPLESKNFWVAEHGASLRLGDVPWHEPWSAPLKVSTVEQRSRMLVATFGEVASAILGALCEDRRTADTFREGAGSKPPKKVYVEEDAIAGVYASPGERFDILLDAPKRGVAHRWRAPDLGSMHADEVLDFCDALDPGTPIPTDGPSGRARIKCVALRPGACMLQLVAVSPGDGHRSDAVTVPISVAEEGLPPGLSSILARCRDGNPAGPADSAGRRASCTPRALLAQPYFMPLDVEELAAAMDSYARLFLSGDDESEDGLPFPAKPGRRGGRQLGGE